MLAATYIISIHIYVCSFYTSTTFLCILQGRLFVRIYHIVHIMYARCYIHYICVLLLYINNLSMHLAETLVREYISYSAYYVCAATYIISICVLLLYINNLSMHLARTLVCGYISYSVYHVCAATYIIPIHIYVFSFYTSTTFLCILRRRLFVGIYDIVYIMYALLHTLYLYTYMCAPFIHQQPVYASCKDACLFVYII